jgi:xylitol oxidase
VRNWAGNVVFSAARRHEPASVPEVQRLAAASTRLKALGTGHSFSLVADTTGDLVSLARLPPLIRIDATRQRVTVSAGMRYGELAIRLDQAGYALGNLGSLPHISVAGAVMTGTHGSGNSSPGLAAAVAAIELVTADGDRLILDRDQARADLPGAGPPGAGPPCAGPPGAGPPGAGLPGADFPGAVVSLGALGIVTRLDLDLEPAYQVRQRVYEDLPFDQLDEHLAGILASGASVSLFTSWRDPRIEQVWVKERVTDQADPDSPPPWPGARPASGPRHPVPGQSPASCTTQLGVTGPWFRRLPHFRPESTPSVGRELQSEFLLPRRHALAAIRAVAEVRERIAPVLAVSEVRTVAADGLWLSPCYQRDAVGVHFTWLDDWPAVEPALRLVEDQLAPFEPRPHWGKLFTIGPAAVAAQYARLSDFGQLRRRYDPAGKFRNAFLDTYLPG